MDISKLCVSKIISASRIKGSVGNAVLRSRRDSFAIAYRTSGETAYEFSGKRISTTPSQAVILPKGCSYIFERVSEGECLFIQFECDGECKEPFAVKVRDGAEIKHYFEVVEKSREDKNEVLAMFGIYGILGVLASSQLSKNALSPQRKKLYPATEYMASHYGDEEITNEFLASLCCVSTVYFRKMFQSEFGTAPISYLHKLRIGKAKELLKSDYVSISEIAESVGYSNIYHFSKMFKIYTGISPSEYAKGKSCLL